MQCEVNWLEARARLTPSHVAIIDEPTGRRWTYQECNQRSNRLASYFQTECKVGKGDRIALLSANHLAHFDTLFACGKLGAIFVPLNIRLAVQELKYLLQDAQLRVLLVHEEYRSLITSLSMSMHLPPTIFIGEEAGDYDRIISSWIETYIPANVDQEDPLLIIYTGGTTGLPKGAVISHRAVTWNSINTIISWGLTSYDISPIYMPLFHTGGINALALPILHAGGTIIIPNKFQPDEAIQLLERERCTVVLLVPTMYQMLLESPLFYSTTFTAMKVFLSGGAPCPLNIYEAFWEKGLVFKEGYGLTEAGPNNFYIDPIDVPRKRGSVGKVMFHQRARIVDEIGQDVPIGRVGELIIQGPHLFSYYWNNQEATVNAFLDGWLRTGDLVRQDADGFFYIVGRRKEMLISGGENVYPLEVEHCIREYAGVAEVAVVGIPHPKWGEQVTAALILSQTISLEKLREFCRERLASYKIPKAFYVVDELPKTSVGKINKQLLREQLESIKKPLH